MQEWGQGPPGSQRPLAPLAPHAAPNGKPVTGMVVRRSTGQARPNAKTRRARAASSASPNRDEKERPRLNSRDGNQTGAVRPPVRAQPRKPDGVGMAPQVDGSPGRRPQERSPRRGRVRVPEEGDNYSEEFFITQFKVLWCPIGVQHNWQHCVYAHNYQDARRHPAMGYGPQPCPHWDKKERAPSYAARCPNGVLCPFAHGAKEQLYHPSYFKTVLCWDFTHTKEGCPRGNLCAFYHQKSERRFCHDWQAPDVSRLLPDTALVYCQPDFESPPFSDAVRDQLLPAGGNQLPPSDYGPLKMPYDDGMDPPAMMSPHAGPMMGGPPFDPNGSPMMSSAHPSSPMGRCVPMLVVDAATGNTVGTAYGQYGEHGQPLSFSPGMGAAEDPLRADTPDPTEQPQVQSPMHRDSPGWIYTGPEGQPMSPMAIQPMQSPTGECGDGMMLAPLNGMYCTPVMGDGIQYGTIPVQSPTGGLGPGGPSPHGSPLQQGAVPHSPHGSPMVLMDHASGGAAGPPGSPQQFPVYAPPLQDFEGMNSNCNMPMGGMSPHAAPYHPGTPIGMGYNGMSGAPMQSMMLDDQRFGQPSSYGMLDMPEMPSEVRRADKPGEKAVGNDSTTDESVPGGEQVASRSSYSE